MPKVDTEDLIDANEVAVLLGLSHRNTVSQYLTKYPDMPRPVIDLGPKRPRLWLRPEIESWVQHRQPVRRGRPPRSSPPPATTPTALSGNKAPPLGGGCVSGGVPNRNNPEGGHKAHFQYGATDHATNLPRSALDRFARYRVGRRRRFRGSPPGTPPVTGPTLRYRASYQIRQQSRSMLHEDQWTAGNAEQDD